MDSSSSRLDTVKWWRGRQELQARKAYTDAHAEERAAREREEQLRDALAKQVRAHGHAAMWELYDLSHAAGEKKLQAAAEVTAKAAKVATEKQQAHLSAHQKLKAVEKVVETMMGEARTEAERKERREADEHAVMRYGR